MKQISFLHGSTAGVPIHHVVGEINQELRQAALGSCVITQDRREGRVAQRLGETLAKSFTSTIIIAQTGEGGC
jgi:hypothetical protein